MSITVTDGRRARGDASRRDILRTAADLASVEGLDGLTIGHLAKVTGRSKSSIATLFGSKEALQLATVETAAEIFRAHIVDPAREHPRGVERLSLLLMGVLDYSRERVFTGGCFFAATSADLDSKTGPVADAVRQWNHTWYGYLERQVQAAVDAGELPIDAAEAELLAFQLIALSDSANMRSLIDGDERHYALAESAMHRLLQAAGAPEAALAHFARRAR